MLLELTISNFRLIKELSAEFAPGLTAITGETGSGKSMLLEALELLLGQRSPGSVVFPGAERAVIAGRFRLPKNGLIAPELLEQFGEAEELLLQRVFTREGRSLCYINNIPAGLKTLEQFGAALVDLLGQAEHTLIFQPPEQAVCLDLFADAQDKRTRFAELLRRARTQAQETRRRRDELERYLREKEFLEFQAQEIEAAAVSPGEDEAVEKELRWRSSIREIQELVGRALETARHREPSAETLLGETHRALSKAAELDETLAGPLENVSEILTRFQETIHEVEAHLQTLEPDDQRLAELEARHDLLWKLKKKYGGSLVRVLEMQQEARQKLDEIGQAESNDTTYEKAHRELLREVNQAGQELRQARQSARERLAAAVRKNLAGLRLDDARFDVTLTPYLSKIETDEDLEKAAIFGLEEVEFRFSANPGAPLQPLRKTASGGELARCALAIKSALAGEDRVPTVVFDEVDSSIGGRLAPVLGEKLTALSASLQVILVTHLPGLARIADVHLKVQKRVEKGVTNIQIQRLDGKERERELREMEGQSGSSKS